MKLRKARVALAAGVICAMAGSANAQTTVNLPDTSLTTTMTAIVSEQATVTVPGTVSFAVTNVGNATVASPASVSITGIVLASATKQLRVSITANTASFTPSVGGGTTWSAGDVTWNGAGWTNATGVAGTLASAGTYNQVGNCNAATSTCSTAGLVFTLGAKPTVNFSGSHTLVVTWKFESF